MAILPFVKISKGDVAIAGGKGASLGEMTCAGIPVPPGFVVLASTFEEFLRSSGIHEEIDAVLHTVDVKAMHTVEGASERIQAIIMGEKIPKAIAGEIERAFHRLGCRFVAVRSSATAEDSVSAAWAGQLDSYLNTTQETLLENVKKCWASLFTPRAIFYRHEKNLHETHISVAVVVQQMVASEVSGIGFSVHPVSCDYNQLIIEAGLGLGEAIVSGQITPDSYVVEKQDWRISDKNISTQTKALYRCKTGGNEWKEIEDRSQKLSDAQIGELSKLIVNIENHYGFPVDVEWAFAEGKFYVVQSRPITTLKREIEKKESGSLKRSLYVFRSRPRKVVPSFPAAYCTEYMASRDGLKEYGFRVSSVIYAATEEDFWAILETNEEVKELQQKLLTRFLNANMYLHDLIEWSESQRNVPKNILKNYLNKSVIKSVSNQELSRRYIEYVNAYRYFHLKNTPAWWLGGEIVEKEIRTYLNEHVDDPDEIFVVLSEALEYPTENASEEKSLLNIAIALQKKKIKHLHSATDIPKNIWLQFEKHVNDFESIPFGYDTGVLWNREHFLEKLNGLLLANCLDIKNNKEKELVEKIKKRNELEQKLHLPPRINLLLQVIRQLAYLQELKKTTQTRSHPLLQRVVHAEIASRLKIPREYLYYMDYREIEKCLKDGAVSSLLNAEIQKRFGDIVLLLNDGTYTWDYGVNARKFMDINGLLVGANDIRELVGQIASRGFFRGVVKVCRLSTEIAKVKQGDILVTAMTTPDFVPAMKRAGAIVTDEGGVTCHAAIVSRELKKPCIIGTKFATQVLKDGDLVEVDAEKGVVTKVSGNSLSYFDGFSFQASRPQTLQKDEVVCDLYKKYPGIRFITTPLEGNQRAWWIDADVEKSMFKDMLQMVSTEQGFKNVLKDYSEIKQKFAKQAKEWERKRLSKKELLKLFRKFHELFIPFSDHVWLAYPIERILDEQFRKNLQSKYPREYEELYGAVSNLTQLTDYQKMRMEICEAVIKHKNIAKDLEKKYSWHSEYSFVEPLLDEKHFKKELSISVKDARDELEKLHEIEGKNKKAFEHALKTIKDKTLDLQARVVNAYVFIRTERVDVFKRFVAPFRNIFAQIASSLKKDSGKPWTSNDVVELLNSELEAYLSGKSVPGLNETRERARHYVYVYDKDGTRAISDKKKVEEIVAHMSKNRKRDTIQGKTAYKGVVKGKAALVFSRNDLSKVTKEHILVARTTMVDYTPAMERAKAIVTAEGGITSHAAIVARELKKPCIVGTGNCMDLIKEGDLVEVDATSGRVKIIKKKSETEITEQIKLKHIVTRKYGLLTSDLFVLGLANPKHYKKVLLLSDAFVGCGVIFDRWMFGSQIADVGRRLLEKEGKKNGFVDTVFANVYLFGEKLLRESEKIKNTDFSSMSDTQLIEIFSDFTAKYSQFSVSLAGWGLQLPVESRLREILNERKNCEEELGILSYPLKKNIIAEEQEDLLVLCIQLAIKEKKVTTYDALNEFSKNLLNKHAEKYGWMTRGGLDDPWSAEDVFSRAVELFKEDCALKLRQLERFRKENISKSKRLLKELGAGKELERLVAIAKELVYYRTYRTDYLNLMMFNIRLLLREIGKRIGYSFIEVSHLRREEIIAFRRIEAVELEQRQKSFLIFGLKPNEVLFTSDPNKIAQYEKEYVISERMSSSIVSGNVAYPGIVKGNVIVVLSKDDLKKVKVGDILVTTMTIPDYVSGMGRAAAFVTDEGGITCHAAIIAREMRKPCVIGTKNATKVLKDGDYVEVDAEKGTIKIIKKAEDNSKSPKTNTRSNKKM